MSSCIVMEARSGAFLILLRDREIPAAVFFLFAAGIAVSDGAPSEHDWR